ncbi:transcriptional regulator [Sphingobacterium faecium]|uniref:transcriptional regulator n=1 Tax=Sphingobacterium faecium TaxID=34087 RepID=UPI0032081B42
MMRKYLCIMLLFIAAVDGLRAQTVTSKLLPTRLKASFERVKDAIPDMDGWYIDQDMEVKALAHTDTTASFEIQEKGLSTEILVDNEKEYNKLVAAAAKDVSKPSIYMLYNYKLKGKKTQFVPIKKSFLFPEYGFIWTLTIKKIAENETELSFSYKSLTPTFANKIEQEFKGDTYYSNKILKISVDDKRMRQRINDILINKMHVDRDYPAPSYPMRN